MEENQQIKNLHILRRVLGIILLVCTACLFYVRYALDVKQILPANEYILVTILKSLTISACAVTIFACFYDDNKALQVVSGFYGLIMGFANLIYFDKIMLGWGKGRDEFSAYYGFAFTTWREIVFIILNVLLIIIAVLTICFNLKDKVYKKANWFYVILTLVGFTFLYMNNHVLENIQNVRHIFTNHDVLHDFNNLHIMAFVGIFLSLIVIVIWLSKKDRKTQRMVMLILAFSSVASFFDISFYSQEHGFYYGNLPFHICNTAVILCTIAYLFNWSGVFYFTFFVNVLGCLFAMLMPNYNEVTTIWYTAASYRFWYTHLICFILPLAGVFLKMFKRPEFKSVVWAFGIFTCYYLLVIVLNVWFTNYEPGINYFFINDYFLFEKLHMTHELMDNYVFEFAFNGLTFRMYPLFYIVVYVVFVALVFTVWVVYDFLFKVSDTHKAIRYKKKLARSYNINFKKELKGRSIHDPLILEAKGMIEIRNFTKVYSGSDKPSVENLNLKIKDGEVYGFLGHNGAGKSTTIKSLVGIQSITSGQMIVDGYDVTKQPVEAKLRIGYVSDNHAVYERLTGREYINYIADLYMVNQKDRDERIAKYTKMFNLEDAIDREIKSYSHGMKQKIVVIASLIHDPKVWVLDEPLTGLDPTSAFQIKECMREHASRGNIVFFSSHVIEVVEKICTSICIISHGKLMCEYKLKDLKKKGLSLEELYLKYVSSEERIH